ncbi:MAG: hypothetical protein JNL19_12410 [Burkholderiales bacterium]|nr:hypothetical protein [Burkholderiales bacterium]
MTRSSITAAVIALSSFLIPSESPAACYTVYGTGDAMVYRSTVPPVDLSQHYGSAIRAKYADGYMIVAPDSASCTSIGETFSGSVKKSASAVLDEREDLDDIAPWATAGTGDKRVYVRSYQRANGTVVQAHTRRAPGAASRGK